MPTRIPTHRPPRLRSASLQAAEHTRPNAAARGYCDNRHKAWRLAVLTRDAWQCQDCGRVCADKRQAHADHISPIVVGTDRCESGQSRYDVSGGQCLCASCHSRKTNTDQHRLFGRGRTPKEPYNHPANPPQGGGGVNLAEHV